MPLTERDQDYIADNYPGVFSHTTSRPFNWEATFAAIGKIAVALLAIWLVVGWLSH